MTAFSLRDLVMLTGLIVAAALVAAMLLWRGYAGSKRRLPRVGAPAPSFSLPDQHGAIRTSAEFRGKWLVLYFYPRDETPGCIEQAVRFRDAMAVLERHGATVCGVSVDDSTSHAAFAAKYKLAFTLLADRGGAVAARYGSLMNLGFLKFARRNTFLIDPEGRIAKVWLGVSPTRNASDVGAELKGLLA